MSNSKARATAIAAGVIGLFVATAVVGYFNFAAVLAAIRPIGAVGFLSAIAAQVALFLPLGLAWWLVAPVDLKHAPVFAWGRLTREAASDVLPFSQLGGLVLAGRSVVLGGVSTAVAFGSIGVDITFEIIAQLSYTLFGLALLVHRLGFAAHDNQLLLPLLAVLAGGVVIAVGLIVTQRRGLKIIERLAQRVIPSAVEHTGQVSKVIEAAYGKPLRLSACLGLHMVGWFGSAAGSWLILKFIDRPTPYLSVVAIESLLYVIRNASFVVPSGLGVQEGAYALLGPMFGLPAEAALALSLLKRARDIAIGIPVLLVWQLLESRALSTSPPSAPV